MNVLGISAFFHDSAACLVVDGEVRAAAQEERFTRQKHDARLPVRATAHCLETAGVEAGDLDYVVFYEKPLRKFERLLVTVLAVFPRGRRFFSACMRKWLGLRLWQRRDIAQQLGVAESKILFSEHHLSHAAAAFLSCPSEHAAIVTVDGVGEWATTTLFAGTRDSSGPQIKKLRELHFPHSIGLLYSALTAYLGFRVNEGEYKVMGLASYGEPRFLKAFRQMASVAEDAALTLDMRFFCFDRDPERAFTAAMEDLLGAARRPGAGWELSSVDGQRWADVAASLQAFTEQYLIALAKHARQLTGARDLCLGGGVALNCVANHKIAREAGFDRVFVHAASGDAGAALGAALFVSRVLLHEPCSGDLGEGPLFLGKLYPEEEVDAAIAAAGVRAEAFESELSLSAAVAERLAANEVGGWFQGAFEWGPRALGHRSVLANPQAEGTKNRVNRKVKFREAFRPFAPAVREEELSTWFDQEGAGDDALLPSMCSALPATVAARQTLPSVVHVDGTSRVQTVSRSHNPRFHALLTAVSKRTGAGVLLNTSMNLKDEPICASPFDALAMFDRSELDFMVLGDRLVTREEKCRD